MLTNKLNIYSIHLYCLCACTGLFTFRVVAQLIQKFYNLPFLPPFNAWHSGALAYHWLLASQILIITIMGLVIFSFIRRRILAIRKLGVWLLILGGIYFITMSFRLIAGLTFAANHYWLGAKIPAFFHIVLASFVLALGHFHYTNSNKYVAHE